MALHNYIMDFTIKRMTRLEQEAEDREAYLNMTHQERLELVEHLRLEAGRFQFYDYPARPQRIITVTRKAER